jgi:hypothetical protein
MAISPDLRPVEALYLLDLAGKEEMTEKNALIAALAYLTSEGYLETGKHELLRFTEKAKTAHGLREYESALLEAVDVQDYTGLADLVACFDFETFLSDEKEFVTVVKKERKLGIAFLSLSYSSGNSVIFTDKGKQALVELDEIKNLVSSAIQQNKADKFLGFMRYAFPTTIGYSPEVISAMIAQELAY